MNGIIILSGIFNTFLKSLYEINLQKHEKTPKQRKTMK